MGRVALQDHQLLLHAVESIGRADRNQAGHAVRVADGQTGQDHAAQAMAQQVGFPHLQVIQHRADVLGHLLHARRTGAVRRVAVALRLDGDDGTMLGESGQEVRREGDLDGHQAARDQHPRRAAGQGSAMDLIVDAQAVGHDASAFELLHRKSPVAAAGARGQRARAEDEPSVGIRHLDAVNVNASQPAILRRAGSLADGNLPRQAEQRLGLGRFGGLGRERARGDRVVVDRRGRGAGPDIRTDVAAAAGRAAARRTRARVLRAEPGQGRDRCRGIGGIMCRLRPDGA